jgi:hypothetical protein
MPISQDRILSLLDEIQLLIDHANLASQQLGEQALSLAQRGHHDIAGELKFLAKELIPPPLPAFTVEARHFRSNARRNVRIRERAERKRREQGILPKSDQHGTFTSLVQKRSYAPDEAYASQEIKRMLDQIEREDKASGTLPPEFYAPPEASPEPQAKPEPSSAPGSPNKPLPPMPKIS